MAMYGNGKDLCQEAREHYYEFLCRGGDAVPEAIARHIEDCPSCQQEIRSLGEMLHEAGDRSVPSSIPAKDAVVETLSRQFELLGEQVRCSHVKPFLPDLAARSSQIRIPTPVTVHVENCPQCAQDLAAIEELGLTAGQSKRLGEFLRLAATDDPAEAGMPAATALAAFSFDEVRPEDLDRVSRCPRRRQWVYEHRARAAAAPAVGTDRTDVLRCDEISMADLFDFVLPFGLDAEALRRTTGRRDAVGTHVRRCRACLERIQSLHRTLYGIAERADTAVGTIYQCEKDECGVSQDEADTPHRYPVNVWVVQGRQASPASNDKPVTQRRSRRLARPLFLTGGASLAAIIALVAGLSFMMSEAKGTNFKDLRKSVRRAPNVYVKSSLEDSPNSGYEMWVSKELNKYAIRSSASCEVTDLNGKTRLIIGPNGERYPLQKLAGATLDYCRAFMDQNALFANAPAEDELTEVPSDASAPRMQTYEIVKDQVGAGDRSSPQRWQVFVDPVQKLPVKAESSQWDSKKRDWNRTNTVELRYPTKAEMESAFRELARTE